VTLLIERLDAFADVVNAIGTHLFDTALLQALNHFAAIDHLTVLTYRPGEGLRTLVVSSRADEGTARSLTRDYVAQHHVLDPNYNDLVRAGRSRQILVRRHDPARLKPGNYVRRFYTTVGIIDKLSYLWRRSDAAYYVNCYRTHRSGPFSRAEVTGLTEVAKLVASTVRMHGGHKRIESAFESRDSGDLLLRLVGLLGERLTSREQEVLTRILMGIGTEGIAIDLGIMPSSVITFRRRAYGKLGITTQAELFARCLRALPRMPMPLDG
jgi:DNA-binding CsgD family transcriptional regulator